MRKGEFSRTLREAFSPEHAPLADEVGGNYELMGRTGNADLQSAKALVTSLYAKVGGGTGEPERPADLPIFFVDEGGNGPVPTAALLTARLTPWIEGLRRRLFGAPEAPFPDDEEQATHWLVQVGRRDRLESTPAEVTEEGRILQEIRLREEAFERLTGAEIYVTVRPIKLPMPVPKLLLVPVTMRRDTDGWLLGRALRDMCEATGFGEWSLLMHVLTGCTPALVPAWLSRSESDALEGFENASLVVRLHRPLSDRALRDLHRQIARTWTDRPADLQLLAHIVAERIGPKKIGPGRSYWVQRDWEAVAEEWEARGMKSQSWRALSERYHAHFVRSGDRHCPRASRSHGRS